jgi:DNA modification methylase
MKSELLDGDWVSVLKTMPDNSVHCVITSPPYWGLRDYGVPGQLGLESTPEEYVAKLVEGFRQVRRLLRDDGTLWLNLGDCYATGAGKVGECPGGGEQGARWVGDVDRIRDDKRGYRGERLANGRGDNPGIFRNKTRADRDGTHAGKHTAMAAMGPMTQPNRMPIPGLKPKDLVGIPWSVAFALQADGWYLRQDIVWSKPNPMPESVGDRCTKAHEYIFLLSKSERYFYDAEAIKEPILTATAKDRIDTGKHRPQRGYPGSKNAGCGRLGDSLKRNKRSVWSVATCPFPGAHFATFPTKLVAPCVLAGTSEAGCCAVCGRPLERLLAPSDSYAKHLGKRMNGYDYEADRMNGMSIGKRVNSDYITVGWDTCCSLFTGDPERCTVLDPFAGAGAGTTGLVAKSLGRNFIGIEISSEYAEMARRRIETGGNSKKTKRERQ